MAVEQVRRRVVQEREGPPFQLGAAESLLEGPPGGGRVAERVGGDRLEEERLDVPQMGVRHHDRAVDDGREHGGRRCRVVLGESQRRLGDADLAPAAFRSVQAIQGLPDPLRRTRAHERLQQVRTQPRGERVRGDEGLGQPFGRQEGAQRGGMAAADRIRACRGRSAAASQQARSTSARTVRSAWPSARSASSSRPWVTIATPMAR